MGFLLDYVPIIVVIIPTIVVICGKKWWDISGYIWLYDGILICRHYWLELYLPLWKIWWCSSGGMMTFPTEWKNKIHVPNHQPGYSHLNNNHPSASFFNNKSEWNPQPVIRICSFCESFLTHNYPILSHQFASNISPEISHEKKWHLPLWSCTCEGNRWSHRPPAGPADHCNQVPEDHKRTSASRIKNVGIQRHESTRKLHRFQNTPNEINALCEWIMFTNFDSWDCRFTYNGSSRPILDSLHFFKLIIYVSTKLIGKKNTIRFN